MSEAPTVLPPLQRLQPLELVALVRILVSEAHVLPPSQQVDHVLEQHYSFQEVLGWKGFGAVGESERDVGGMPQPNLEAGLVVKTTGLDKVGGVEESQPLVVASRVVGARLPGRQVQALGAEAEQHQQG